MSAKLFISTVTNEFKRRSERPSEDLRSARGNLRCGKAKLAKTRTIVEKHGYWRRKEELEDAEAAAENW